MGIGWGLGWGQKRRSKCCSHLPGKKQDGVGYRLPLRLMPRGVGSRCDPHDPLQSQLWRSAQLAEGVSQASVPWPGLYRLSERQGKLHGHCMVGT